MRIVITEVPGTLKSEYDTEKSFCADDMELVVVVYDERAENNDKFFAEIADADAIVNSYVYFDKEKIDAMKNCKVISFQSTGYNEVDLDYAREKGIPVVSILDYCTQETAENAFAMMLALQRSTIIYDRAIQQDKNWDVYLAPGMKRIEGQTMGIVGLGRIGQSVARKAFGFDMKVIAYDPYLPPEIAEKLGVRLVDLDTILTESDVISVHMNLTPENVHMFNKETFKKMKKCPILINEGRGPMISEEDLAWALDQGLVRAAGLDMLESETPDAAYLKTCPLVGRSNVILNPHSGFMSETSMALLAKEGMRNAISMLTGKALENGAIRNGV